MGNIMPASAFRWGVAASIFLYFLFSQRANAQADEYDPATVSGSVAAIGQALTDSALAAEGEGDRTLFVLELKVKKDWENNSIFVHIWGGEGDTVYPGAGKSAMALAPGEIELAAAQYSRKLFEFLTFTIGKINPSAYFDSNAIANNGYTQFLANAFVNNSAILFPDHEIGYLLEARGGDFFTFQFGVFEDREAEVQSEFENKFIIGEFGLHYTIVDSPGNLRLTGWNSSALEQGGVAINLDQELGEYFAIFTRIGAASNPAEDTIAQAFSFGGRINFADLFQVGLAYEMQLPGDPELFDAQSWFEMYVGKTLEDGVSFGVDLQTVSNPEFDSTQDGPVILSFRLYAPF